MYTGHKKFYARLRKIEVIVHPTLRACYVAGNHIDTEKWRAIEDPQYRAIFKRWHKTSWGCCTHMVNTKTGKVDKYIINLWFNKKTTDIDLISTISHEVAHCFDAGWFKSEEFKATTVANITEESLRLFNTIVKDRVGSYTWELK